MDGNALVNMLKDRRILVIILAVIVIVAAVGAYMLLKDDGGSSDQPSNGLIVDNERTISEDTVVEGTLQITENGKLTITNGAEIRMLGADAKVDVKGTLDATDGTITFVKQEDDGSYTPVYENGEGETRAVTSSGTLMLNISNYMFTTGWDEQVLLGLINFVNGASYAPDDNTVVVTSLVNAIGSQTHLDNVVILQGNYTESGSVTIPSDMSVNVLDGASITLGTVMMSSDSIMAVGGSLSGTIGTSNGAMNVDNVSSIEFRTVSIGNTSYILVTSNTAGDMTVTSGRVYVDTIILQSGTNLTVDPGAEIVLEAIPGESSVSSTTGHISAASGVTGYDVNVNGIMTIGTKPTDMDNISDSSRTCGVNATILFGETGYAKVYAGNDQSVSNVKSTQFLIDGERYMTVYGNGTISSVLGKEGFDKGVADDETAKNVAGWNTEENQSGTAVGNDTVIGADGYTNVYFASEKYTITVAVSEGITLSIDGKAVTGTSIVLSAGEHEIGIAPEDVDIKSATLGTTNISFTGTKATIDVTADATLTITGSVPSSSS